MTEYKRACCIFVYNRAIKILSVRLWVALGNIATRREIVPCYVLGQLDVREKHAPTTEAKDLHIVQHLAAGFRRGLVPTVQVSDYFSARITTMREFHVIVIVFKVIFKVR
jgi:hypothetical protein